MTIEQIKQVAEIARAGSLNKAAETLYISQPNLSRSLKQLEEELGFSIFYRTNRGVEVTIQGQQFLAFAQTITDNITKINQIGHPDRENQEFSISVPKAAYITKTFRYFISCLDTEKSLSVDYKETSPIGAINNILVHNFNLGIIRYQDEYRPLFDLYLSESGLIKREICTFRYKVAFSENSPLAAKPSLCKEDLREYLEVTHGDSYLPGFTNEERKNENGFSQNVIRVYDSMGQLQLLNEVPNTYMIVFPFDEETLKKYHLVQRELTDFNGKVRDYLISRSNYVGSKLDKIFCDELTRNASKI